MRDGANEGVFDEVVEFPDPSARRRFAGLVGLDATKERLVKEAMMRLQPSSLEQWSQANHGCVIPAVQYFGRRPPLFVLAGDVGTGKSELAKTFGDEVARKSSTTVFLHSLSLNARGSGAVGEMTRLISGAINVVKSEARELSEGQSAAAGHILLIDEADALAQSRESAQMHHEDRAGVNALIRGIDDLAEGRRPVLIVMCTNRLSALDPAVLRRSAATFRFSRPNPEQRKAVLRNALPDGILSDAELGRVVELTGPTRERAIGFSFSDLTQRLIPSAVLAAYPGKPISGTLLAELAREIEPTPAFTEE